MENRFHCAEQLGRQQRVSQVQATTVEIHGLLDTGLASIVDVHHASRYKYPLAVDFHKVHCWCHEVSKTFVY
jgi:hypothetical protein